MLGSNSFFLCIRSLCLILIAGTAKLIDSRSKWYDFSNPFLVLFSVFYYSN
jgi:hypothetical protein